MMRTSRARILSTHHTSFTRYSNRVSFKLLLFASPRNRCFGKRPATAYTPLRSYHSPYRLCTITGMYYRLSSPTVHVYQSSEYPSSRILAFQNSSLALLQTSFPPQAFQRSPASYVSVAALQTSSRSSSAIRSHCAQAGICSLMYFPPGESGDFSSAMAKDLKPSIR